MIFQVVLTLLLIVIFLIWKAHEWPSKRTIDLLKKVNGPDSVFLFGHTLLVARTKCEALIKTVENMCEEHGPIFKLWFLNIPLVILNDAESVEALLSSVNHIDKGVLYNVFDKWLNEGLLISSDSKWHYRRKLLTPAFHFKILEDCIPIFNRNANHLTHELLKMQDEVIVIEPFISKCTLFIICEGAMGISLSNLPDKGERYVSATKKINHLNMRRMFNPLLFRNALFDLTPMGWEYNKELKILHSFTKMVINQRMQSRQCNTMKEKSQSESKNHKTFLDCLLELNDNNPDLLSIDDIREEVDTFMFEGHDTTSAAITAALFLLGHNPQIQDLVYEELNEVFGDSDRDATCDDLKNLDYLDRVIKETLRMLPSVPAVQRRLVKDLPLPHKNLVIPASAHVTCVPLFLHRNPKYFPEPDKFDPDRFIRENSQNRHPFSYIPFSGGPRNCIGQKFAKMELKVVLSTILRKLSVESVTKMDEYVLLPTVILRPQHPFKVKLFVRDGNHLRPTTH